MPAPGVAAPDAPQGQPAPAPGAILLQGLGRVGRAGRLKPAAGRRERRNQLLVQPDERQEELPEEKRHGKSKQKVRLSGSKLPLVAATPLAEVLSRRRRRDFQPQARGKSPDLRNGDGNRCSTAVILETDPVLRREVAPPKAAKTSASGQWSAVNSRQVVNLILELRNGRFLPIHSLTNKFPC